MNFKELRQHFTTEISDLFSHEESLSLFYNILEHLTGWKRSDYMMNSSESVEMFQQTAFLEFGKELKGGKPIQYVLGETFFYGLKFFVNQDVLIPRPETEELVQWILDEYPQSQASQEISILDVGTGSGCIAVSLQKKISLADVSAMDVSKSALEVASKNAEFNGVRLNLIQADILAYKSDIHYDIIVSNPPYIRNEEQKEMHENVLGFEPHLALFVENKNPLVFYKAIADFALTNLNTNGNLFFEINESFGQEMIDMLDVKGFKNIELKKDMQLKDRMICCTK
jgi:release factor glutamine methyltransferase